MARKKAEATPAPDVAPVPTEVFVESIKGFDGDLKCRGHQFEIGQTYTHDGEVRACHGGFHACPTDHHPLSVFEFYPPAGNRFAIVRQSGQTHSDGSNKLASAKITIDAEIRLPELVERAVKWVFDRAKWIDGPVATGENEAATASGDQGAATASGDQGAATASGDQGAATASGDQGRTQGKEGCALFLVYRDPRNGDIKHAWAGIVGRDGIKPMVWYTLGADGKPVEA